MRCMASRSESLTRVVTVSAWNVAWFTCRATRRPKASSPVAATAAAQSRVVWLNGIRASGFARQAGSIPASQNSGSQAMPAWTSAARIARAQLASDVMLSAAVIDGQPTAHWRKQSYDWRIRPCLAPAGPGY